MNFINKLFKRLDLYNTFFFLILNDRLNRLLNHEDDIFDENLFKISKNKFILSLSEKYQITSLISTEHFLIAGIGNEIVGWSWSNIINLESTNFPKSSWNIRIPPTKYVLLIKFHPSSNYI